MLSNTLTHSPLGKTLPYITKYDPTLLFAILREDSRTNLGIAQQPPFEGVDIWNAYELSWINLKGKPLTAVAEIYVPCHSKYLFESKSLKRYLHSFNQTKFASPDAVRDTLEKIFLPCVKMRFMYSSDLQTSSRTYRWIILKAHVSMTWM